MTTTTAPEIIAYNGRRLVVNEDTFVDEYLSTNVRVLDENRVDLTVSRHFLEKGGKAEVAEGYEVFTQHASVIVTTAQAVAFAHAILEQVSQAE